MTSQNQEWGQSPANLTKSKFSEYMQVWYTKRLWIPFSTKLLSRNFEFPKFSKFGFERIFLYFYKNVKYDP